MTAKIIDGKAFASNLRVSIKEAVTQLIDQTGNKPGLAVVLVGEDPASSVYVKNKGKATLEAGMESFEIRLPENTTQEELLRKIESLNSDERVHGILVQLPLPNHIDEHAIINMIDPDKDVDGFHVSNVGRLVAGQAALMPCTPLGCLMLLKDTLGDLTGLHTVIIGRSNIVGKPMAALLLQESCTVTICHSRTKNIEDITKQADILVSAIGKPGLVKAHWVKPGASVIDVGINRIETTEGKSKLVGDIDFEAVKDVAAAITPVPGGVGPMTIACLLRNTVMAFCNQNNLPEPTNL